MKRQQPYQKLGSTLKELRKRRQETISELSSALEIDEEIIREIELGHTQPTEEVLELIASHFELDEVSSDNLWKLAGYVDNQDSIQTVFVPMQELKISYTDMVHVTVNKYGVVVNFMQNGGANSQPTVVSRLGMSKEHALSVVEVLSRTIQKSIEQESDKNNQQQKLLGSPDA